MTAKKVSVQIDGEALSVEEGKLVLEAAAEAGIVIPHFCYHQRLEPVAACRLCLVEIDGMRGLQPSCATRVKEGMIVRTTTKPALESHKEVLDLVLETHPLDCGKCEAAGRCQLEDFTYEFGPHRVSYYHPPGISGVHYQETDWSPLIRFDPFKCVECTRCIRVCDEVQDCRALGAGHRGHRFTISTFAGGPLHCDFCGSCASVCPTGAIEQQTGKFFKKDWEMERRAAICPHCGHGCTLVLRTHAGKIVRVEDDLAKGNNAANLCAAGRFAFDLHETADRLAAPLVRRDGELVECSWDEALETAAEVIGEARGGHGRIVGLGSGFLSVEDLFAFGTLVRGLGGKTKVHARDGHVAAAVSRALGSPGSTVSFSAVRNYETIVLVDADLAQVDPVTRVEVMAARRKNGASVVALGEPSARDRIAVTALPASPTSVSGIEGKALWIIDAERVSAGLLEEILKRAAADSLRNGILLLASSPNGRALGPLGFACASSPDDLSGDLLLVAGEQRISRKPSGVKRMIVSTAYRSGLALDADIVLPAALPYEKPGTWIAGDQSVQHSQPSAAVHNLAWPDGATWSQLAGLLEIDIPSKPADLLAAARDQHPALSGGKIDDEQLGALPAPIEQPAGCRSPLVEHSDWMKTLRTHLESSKEYAPWPS